MRTASDKKRQEFMAWMGNHPEIKDISKHLVADFLNQYNATCSRLASIKKNNDLEIVSEFGYKAKEALLGEVFASHEWQDTNEEVFKVVAGISQTPWLKGNQVYVSPLKVNSVNIGYSQIVFMDSPAPTELEEVTHLLEDLSTGLSLYLGYQNELMKYYARVEELANLLQMSNSGSASRVKLLTPRQRAILELMALGETNDEIADKLGFSTGTIHAESSEIYRILQITGRKGAVSALNAHRSPTQAQVNKPTLG
jgi:DNA-binding CsgD family transcriptional regulator